MPGVTPWTGFTFSVEELSLKLICQMIKFTADATKSASFPPAAAH